MSNRSTRLDCARRINGLRFSRGEHCYGDIFSDSGGRDKYRRRLGDLILDGKSAAELTVPAYARRYNGKTRRISWCVETERLASSIVVSAQQH